MWKPPLREPDPESTFHERLRAAGKLAKLALTAAMRNLLVTLNAMLKHGTAWNAHRPA
jgi:transposase